VDDVEKRKFLTLPGLELRLLGYTDWKEVKLRLDKGIAKPAL
jgi:hypothetical protein